MLEESKNEIGNASEMENDEICIVPLDSRNHFQTDIEERRRAASTQCSQLKRRL